MQDSNRTDVSRSHAQRIIVMIWDGMRPDFVTPELTPHLSALMQEGATYRRATSIFPSVTRPVTASMSTGTYPAAHGIINNLFLGPPDDRAPIDTGDPASLARLRAMNGDRLLPVRTLPEVLAATGRRYVALSSCSEGQAQLLDSEGAGTIIHPTFTAPASLMTTLTDRFGPPPVKAIPVQAANDWLTAVLIEYVLPELAPAVTVLWLCEPDATQHACGLGAPESLAAIRGNDDCLGRVRAAVDASHVPTTIIVASDHGHTTASGMVRVTEGLRTEGFGLALDRGQVIVGDEAIVIEDGPAADAYGVAVATWLVEQPWMGALVAWTGGRKVAPPNTLGIDAFWPGPLRPPLVHAPTFTWSYAWTNEPNTYGVPGSAYVGPAEELTDLAHLQGPIVGLDRLVSWHGTLSPYDLHVVLTLVGAGIRTCELDTPAGVMDIAPTILALLGLDPSLLPGVDGRALTEAFIAHNDASAISVRSEYLTFVRSGVIWRHWVGSVAYLDTQAP